MNAKYPTARQCAIGIDVATLERARRVADQAAENIYATNSTDLNRSRLIAGYCDDLDELLADTLRLAIGVVRFK